MCFSAEASFTAAAVLSGIGTLCVRERRDNSRLALTLIPWFFALQQATEGVLWLHLADGNLDSLWAQGALWTFSLFAYGFWPTWVPLAFFLAESDRERKRFMLYLTSAGALLSVLHLYWVSTHGIIASVACNSIHYGGSEPLSRPLFELSRWWYIGVVVPPPLLSTLKRAWAFGVLNAIGFGVALWFYEETFASIWCFFASLTGVYIHLILRWDRRR